MNSLVSRRRRKLEHIRSEGSCGVLCLIVEATKRGLSAVDGSMLVECVECAIWRGAGVLGGAL